MERTTARASRPVRRTIGPTSAAGAVLVIAVLLLGSRTTLRYAAGDGASSRGAEVARLRAHFDSVQRELLDRDVSSLTPEQRARRLRHLRALDVYRERGVFPHNHDFPGRRAPYFVDAGGTPSAIAYLVAASGRRDIVERIAAERNHATIAQLANDAPFRAWLDSSGFTLVEAARIQPTYEWQPDAGAPDRHGDTR
jgi:hypothetical protein